MRQPSRWRNSSTTSLISARRERFGRLGDPGIYFLPCVRYTLDILTLARQGYWNCRSGVGEKFAYAVGVALVERYALFTPRILALVVSERNDAFGSPSVSEHQPE